MAGFMQFNPSAHFYLIYHDWKYGGCRFKGKSIASYYTAPLYSSFLLDPLPFREIVSFVYFDITGLE